MLGDRVALLGEPPLDSLEPATTVLPRAGGWIEGVGNRLDFLDLPAEFSLNPLHFVQSTVDARR
jgi:hypothetical protein